MFAQQETYPEKKGKALEINQQLTSSAVHPPDKEKKNTPPVVNMFPTHTG